MALLKPFVFQTFTFINVAPFQLAKKKQILTLQMNATAAEVMLQPFCRLFIALGKQISSY